MIEKKLLVLCITLTGLTPPVAQLKECKEVGPLRIPGCSNATLAELQLTNDKCGESIRIQKFTQWLDSIGKPCSTIVKDNSLRNRVQNDIAIYVKPFSTTVLERAFVAVGKWQKQNDLVRMLVPVKTRIDLPLIFRITDSLGIPENELSESLQNKTVITYVDSSRAEALRNGVTLTPTFVINGKRYQGYKDARWVLDAAENELEK
jgi:hypothetical protein